MASILIEKLLLVSSIKVKWDMKNSLNNFKITETRGTTEGAIWSQAIVASKSQMFQIYVLILFQRRASFPASAVNRTVKVLLAFQEFAFISLRLLSLA